jgi:hypothetical protein
VTSSRRRSSNPSSARAAGRAEALADVIGWNRGAPRSVAPRPITTAWPTPVDGRRSSTSLVAPCGWARTVPGSQHPLTGRSSREVPRCVPGSPTIRRPASSLGWCSSGGGGCARSSASCTAAYEHSLQRAPRLAQRTRHTQPCSLTASRRGMSSQPRLQLLGSSHGWPHLRADHR